MSGLTQIFRSLTSDNRRRDVGFRDREADGMRKTVLIQASKNCTSKEPNEKREWFKVVSRRRTAAAYLTTPLRRGFFLPVVHTHYSGNIKLNPQKRH
jgi:hypothetical protein